MKKQSDVMPEESAELIQETQSELNMEETNKVIFELSQLICQFNRKAFEQENVSILSKRLLSASN